MDGIDFLKIEELILLAIAGKIEIYGLEISSDITQATENKVRINYGSLYPYLNRLEKKGYITSRWEEENARKGARRKYYKISSLGLQSLDEAALIRQQLRQTLGSDSTLTSKSDSNLDEFLQPLQHPQEDMRIQAIQKLETLAQNYPEHHWKIIQALASFIRSNSPTKNLILSISPDIQTALGVIGNRNTKQDPSKEIIDLSSTNLISAILKRSNLKGVNLSRSNLKGIYFSLVNLSETNLEGANLSNASLEGVNLSGANLNGVNLSEAEMSEATDEFEGTGIQVNLSGASLIRTNLEETDLDEVNMEGVRMEEANLKGANLHCINLKGANLRGANLSSVMFSGVNLSGASFIGANLSNADLSGENLSSANLSEANLSEANLSEANLSEVKNLNALQLRSAYNWEQAIGLPDYLK
jgi:uncharacterized protein YjbI with pentapeptide repeats/DNA-binding PadR family transcriptional regulator